MNPNGLVAGRVDHFPHVDAQPVAHQRDLVDQADVDGAERVLEQLDHLGHARRCRPGRPSSTTLP